MALPTAQPDTDRRFIGDYFHQLENTIHSQNQCMMQMQEQLRHLELSLGWLSAHWPIAGQIKPGFPYTSCPSACGYCQTHTPTSVMCRFGFPHAHGGTQVVIQQMFPIVDPAHVVSTSVSDAVAAESIDNNDNSDSMNDGGAATPSYIGGSDSGSESCQQANNNN